MSLLDDVIDLDFDPAEEDYPIHSFEPPAEEAEPPELVKDVASSQPAETAGKVEKSRNRHRRVRCQSESSESDADERRLSADRREDLDYRSPLKRGTRETLPPKDASKSAYVDSSEVRSLYRSMDVDPHSGRHRLHSVFVLGVDNLNVYQIEKIFAEYAPEAIEMVGDASCNVIWDSRLPAAEMMLGMTKPLKRVRGGRQIEEGEVPESDEEEDGEMREEHGDDVTISMSKDELAAAPNNGTVLGDAIEVDVNQVEVPPGKWRVVTKHVGQNRLMILRFSLRAEIGKGCVKLRKESEPEVDEDGFSYKATYKQSRVRPGLNIFDDKGDELDWDYEHDTRFYEDLDGRKSKEEGTRAPMGSEVTAVSKVKTRGRGAKRFRLDDSDAEEGSLAADREDFSIKRRRRGDVDESRWKTYEEEDFTDD